MFVIPVAPRVLDPRSKRPLPATGREVPETTYWIRRLRCGDVTLKPQPAVDPSPLPVVSNDQES